MEHHHSIIRDLSEKMKSAVMPDKPFEQDSTHRKPSELASGKAKKNGIGGVSGGGHLKPIDGKLKNIRRRLHEPNHPHDHKPPPPGKGPPHGKDGDSDSDSDEEEDFYASKRNATKALANQFSQAFALVNSTCIDNQQEAAPNKDCTDALLKLYSLQDQYISSASSLYSSTQPPPPPPHHHPLLGPLIIVAVFVVLIAKKVYFGRYRKFRKQQIHAVLEAIKSNPTVKATVEAEIGMPLVNKYISYPFYYYYSVPIAQ